MEAKYRGRRNRPPRCARRVLTGCARLLTQHVWTSFVKVHGQPHVSPVETVAHPTKFQDIHRRSHIFGQISCFFLRNQSSDLSVYSQPARDGSVSRSTRRSTHSRFMQGLSPDVIPKREEKSLQHGAAVSYCGKRRSQSPGSRKPTAARAIAYLRPVGKPPQERTDAEICSGAEIITKNAG